MNTIEEVLDFAAYCHGDQEYGDGQPYMYHVRKAVEVLRRFGFNEVEHRDIFDATALHDTVEDCPITCQGLFMQGFNPNVINLVYAVTNEDGRNRAERHKKTYGKIFNTENAIVVKLSDRIANVEAKGKVEMYRREYPDFIKVLKGAKTTHPRQVGEMWNHLDSLLIEASPQRLPEA